MTAHEIASRWVLRKAEDQAFWEWVAQKHPQVPNPDPDGRKDQIAPSTLREYAEGTPKTPRERRRQQGAAQIVQRLQQAYQKAKGDQTTREQPQEAALSDVRRIVKDKGKIAVVALAAALGVAPEKVLEAAMPDLMDGKIHLEEGPTFVDWSDKKDRGAPQPMPKIRRAFVQVYLAGAHTALNPAV